MSVRTSHVVLCGIGRVETVSGERPPTMMHTCAPVPQALSAWAVRMGRHLNSVELIGMRAGFQCVYRVKAGDEIECGQASAAGGAA